MQIVEGLGPAGAVQAVDDHLVQVGQLAVGPFGQGHRLHQGGGAGQGVDAGLGHGAVDGDPLALGVLDHYGHLRIVDVLLAELGGDLGGQLLGGPAGRRHLAQ